MQINALSFGGGTQSNAIAVLISQRRLPAPDVAIIADTGYEPATTWDYFNKYGAPMLAAAGVKVMKACRADTTMDPKYLSPVVKSAKHGRLAQIPTFYKYDDDRRGKDFAYCSGAWKKDVVRHALNREYPAAKVFYEWIGYSFDEVPRAKKAKVAAGKWRRRYPLIELALTRQQCIDLVIAAGLPRPPRSACYFCPNKSDAEWKETTPADFAAAQKFERWLQRADERHASGEKYVTLHRSGENLSLDILTGGDVLAGNCDIGGCFT